MTIKLFAFRVNGMWLIKKRGDILACESFIFIIDRRKLLPRFQYDSYKIIMSADDDDGNSAGPFLKSILFISIKQRNSIVKAKTASERVREWESESEENNNQSGEKYIRVRDICVRYKIVCNCSQWNIVFGYISTYRWEKKKRNTQKKRIKLTYRNRKLFLHLIQCSHSGINASSVWARTKVLKSTRETTENGNEDEESCEHRQNTLEMYVRDVNLVAMVRDWLHSYLALHSFIRSLFLAR